MFNLLNVSIMANKNSAWTIVEIILAIVTTVVSMLKKAFSKDE